MKLKNHLATLERGGASKLADELGVSISYLSQMASGKAPISPERMVLIEQLTDGAVTRKDEFPDNWKRIWPELDAVADSRSALENTPLKRIRLKREQTLEVVSVAVGTDTGNLSRIERGLQVPSKDLTEKLAKFFNNEVTETQIIYPERFAEPEALPPSDYVGPERRTGEEPGQILPRKRSTNGH